MALTMSEISQLFKERRQSFPKLKLALEREREVPGGLLRVGQSHPLALVTEKSDALKILSTCN